MSILIFKFVSDFEFYFVMPKDLDRHIFEYSEITSQIYIGANACCKVHLKDELVHKGINAEINLEEAEAETPIGLEAYLWLPTKDDFAPNFAQLEIGVRALEGLIRHNKKVLVHCLNGHGRSPTLVIAYFLAQGWALEDALKLIKQKRPEIHLTEYQLRALEEWKEWIKNTRTHR